MKTRNTYIILATSLLFFASCKGQTNDKSKTGTSQNTQIDNYELSPETANPKAKELMTEKFYWDPSDEFAPFGSDDGSDAFYGFRQWRQSNPNISPTVYLRKLNDEWGYQSNKATIAIGFGQFVLEGRIDADLKALTKEALNKQFAPNAFDAFDSEIKKFRTERLAKMMAVVDKMN
jgi:uncharacterized protein YfeS